MLRSSNYYKQFLLFPILLCGALLSSCGLFMSSATQGLADSLSSAVLNSDDPATVAQGLPAYLLLLDGLLESDANNASLLRAAADLNAAYAGVFAQSAEQSQRLSDKSLDYAQRAFCIKNSAACPILSLSFNELQALVGKFSQRDIDYLYTLGSTWTGWIDANRADWNAIAQIDRAKLLLTRVIELNEGYNHGFAHIYLGSLATLVPPGLGGKPEIAKQHFEKAIALSDGTNLMAQVNYAQRYARLLFDRELHDRLIDQVLNTDATNDGLTLTNTLAKQQATLLKKDADDYF